MIFLLIIQRGDIPDPDRNAHDMWAGQLLEKGSLVISESGITDDWRIYYPNTVPKPFEMISGLLRAPGGTLWHSLFTVIMAALVIAAVRAAAGGGDSGIQAGYFLGLNPVFLFLCIRGNPAIPFLGAIFLMQTVKGSPAGAVLASLTRPEGFIYGVWHCISKKKWKLLLLFAVTAGIWLLFHKMACGSFTWASREVKYSVAAMAYPTPNPVTLLPWALLRSVLILGAPAAAILYGSFGRWELKVPFMINFALLAVSLALGSLVLPRYIDQLFLLAVPFIFKEIHGMFRGRAKRAILAAVILFPSFQWVATAPEIREYTEIRGIYSSVELPEEGVLAANELLIPGIALSNSISDPGSFFVSSDRAAWAGVTEEELFSHNVQKVLVVPLGVYYPEHTENWLNTMDSIEVDYFPR